MFARTTCLLTRYRDYDGGGDKDGRDFNVCSRLADQSRGEPVPLRLLCHNRQSMTSSEEEEKLINPHLSLIFLSGMTFDLTHPRDRWESIRGARSRLSLNPAIFSDVKVCLAPPQVPSKSRPQQPSKRRPPLRGSARAKASVFHTTQLLLPKFVSTRLSSPSSRFFRKAALDDACAGVSSFRDNGERAGQER